MAYTRRLTAKDATWQRAWTADALVDLVSISALLGVEGPHRGDAAFVTATGFYYLWMDDGSWAQVTGLPSGTVTAISIATANGFAGSSSGGATPILTLSTTVTGILKGNGTVISAAVAGDFPTLNQNTTGSAATLTTPRNINGVAFDGSANITITAAPTAHATTHSSGGSDPVSVLNLGGYPGGTTTFLRADGSFATPTNSGYVVGPASSVDLRIAVFSGTTGKLIADGGEVLSNIPKLNALNTFTAFGSHNISTGGTGPNYLTIRNTTAGTGNYAMLRLGNDAAANVLEFAALSSTYTTAGQYVQDCVVLNATRVGGLSIASEHASGNIRFYTANAIRGTMHASGGFSWGDTTDPGAAGLRWGISQVLSWVAKSVNTDYQAASDGFVIVFGIATTGVWTATCYTDSASTPTTIVAQDAQTIAAYFNFMFPVKKGDYYRFTQAGTAAGTIKWIPLGFNG